jgi:hypothetical protein
MPSDHPVKSKAPIKLPPIEYLHKCFDYNAETGVLRWKTRPKEQFHKARMWKMWNTRFAGQVAGSLHKTLGYRDISLDYQLYRAHRIIFKLMTGEEPPDNPDHKNRNRADNQWDNLRPATQSEQNYNMGLRKDNTSGYRGVVRDRGRWRAEYKINGVTKHIGAFATPEEASAAYETAARKLHGEFYRR